MTHPERPPIAAPTRRSLFALVAALLGLGLAAGVAEGVARSVERRWLTDMLGWQVADLPVHRVSPDPDLLYELAPGARWVSPDGRELRINDLGFRDPPRTAAKPEGTFRVLCLGGSNTYGAAVQAHETWPAALERELAARRDGPVEVWNLGVSGWDTGQKVTQARRVIDLHDPDLLIFQLYNAGPRLLLHGDDPVERIRWDPTLLGAWNEGAMAHMRPGPLSRVSAFARLAWWRAVRIEQGNAMDWRLVAARRAWSAGMADLASLVEELQGTPEALGLIIPAGFQYFSECGPQEQVPSTPDEFSACFSHVTALGELRGTGLPLLDLTAEAIPDLPAVRDSHPGADVYAWYARRLADTLVPGSEPRLLDGFVPGARHDHLEQARR